MDENQSIVAGDKATVKAIFARIVDGLKGLGYSDIMADPKARHCRPTCSNSYDRYAIRTALDSSAVRVPSLQPSSTYHELQLELPEKCHLPSLNHNLSQ